MFIVDIKQFKSWIAKLCPGLQCTLLRAKATVCTVLLLTACGYWVLPVLQLVVRAIDAGDQTVLADALRIGQYKPGEQVESQDLANRLFHTVFMGTVNSSTDTRSRWDGDGAQGFGEWGSKPFIFGSTRV